MKFDRFSVHCLDGYFGTMSGVKDPHKVQEVKDKYPPGTYLLIKSIGIIDFEKPLMARVEDVDNYGIIYVECATCTDTLEISYLTEDDDFEIMN